MVASMAALEARIGDALTLDALTGDYWVYQRKRGHRFSVDDALTAWYAAEHGTEPETHLDLGTGIGSVALSLAWLWPKARVTAVEAQDVSFALLEANVGGNELGRRVRTLHADLRTLDTHPSSYPSITGTPPYFPRTAATVPADTQKAHARFELRGTVADYCRIVRARLTREGRFFFCFPAGQRRRAEAACETNDLVVFATRDVIPRAGRPALFSLFACALPGAAVARAPVGREPDFVVRDADGIQTEELRASRRRFGVG
jgi:tRNA1(Val) A37 N6-methylase TrmN6